MFFPALINMSNYKIGETLYNNLDQWLGTTRIAVRKSLNPLQFSRDYQISEDVATQLFLLCTSEEFSILKAKYILECPICNSILLNSDTYPKSTEVYCIECNVRNTILDDDIIIQFELIQDPENKLTSYKANGIDQGKAISLRAGTIREGKSSYADFALRLADQILFPLKGEANEAINSFS